MSTRRLARSVRRPWRLVTLEDRLAPATAMLPDLHVLQANLSGWTVGTTAGGGRELRYATALANGGQGAFELRGTTQYSTAPDGTQLQIVNQRVYNDDATFTDRVAGNFVYHPTHGHIHFEDMAWGQVRIRTAGNGLGDVVAVGPKTSFALIDINRYNPSLPGSPSSGQYGGGNIQGISVGWNDVYGSSLAGQQINITGLPNGDYWLEVVSDPMDHILESNETNNVTRIPITLTGLPPAGFRIQTATPFGAQNDPVGSVEVTFNQAVNPDTFTAEDVVFNTPGGPVTATGVTALSTVRFRIEFATQGAVGTYTMTIGPNIQSSTGGMMDQNNNGTTGELADNYINIFTVTAPRVLGTTPTGNATPPFSTIRVLFSKPMDVASFTTADIAQFSGPGSVDLRTQITGIVPVTTGATSNEFDINFTAQTAIGSYTLVLEPTILDAHGNAVDMNGDNQSTVADRYTANLVVTPPGTVGPDTFGYDARTAALQSLNLVGQTGTVTMSFTNFDDGSTSINLGTDKFNFYGTTYTGASQLFVSTNGLLSFGGTYTEWQNGDLTAGTRPVIAALWDDWDLSNGVGQVLYRFFDDNLDGTRDRLVVQWNQVLHHDAPTGANGQTFQLVLRLNTGATPGDVFFNYPDLTSGDQFAGGASATVGLRSTAAVRLLVSNSATSPLIGTGKAIGLGVPTVSSIIRMDLPTSPAGDVEFQVTFSHPVTGVDVNDFTLTTTGGLSGARVDHIHATSDPAVYEVHVETGPGSGTVRLNLADNGTITSLLNAALGGTGAANGNYDRGEIYDIVQPPPKVFGVNIGDGTSQRSQVDEVKVVFDWPVVFNGDPALAFQLTDAVTQAAVAITVDVVSLSTPEQTVARLTFTGAGSDNGSLADGRYNLTVLGSQISTGGVALDGNGDGAPGGDYTAPASANLYRLFGDADGNGTVDLLDLQALRSTFTAGTGSAAYLSYLDYDGGGVVDLLDLAEFRNRFNRSV